LGATVATRLLQTSSALFLDNRNMVSAHAAHGLGVLPIVSCQCWHWIARRMDDSAPPAHYKHWCASQRCASNIDPLLQRYGVEFQREHGPSIAVALDDICIHSGRPNTGLQLRFSVRFTRSLFDAVEVLFDLAAGVVLYSGMPSS
jgi:hypothetical protein